MKDEKGHALAEGDWVLQPIADEESQLGRVVGLHERYVVVAYLGKGVKTAKRLDLMETIWRPGQPARYPAEIVEAWA